MALVSTLKEKSSRAKPASYAFAPANVLGQMIGVLDASRLHELRSSKRTNNLVGMI